MVLCVLWLFVVYEHSLLPQHQIDHPAAAGVWARAAAMAQDVWVATTRFCKGVGQCRHPLEGTVIVAFI